MNVDSSMCASSGKAAHWDQIDWSKYERQVRRLQARIVKATREGRWGKVQALQLLLTHSFSGKALAVKRVTEWMGRSGALRLPNSRPSSRCNLTDTSRCLCAASISRKPTENKGRLESRRWFHTAHDAISFRICWLFDLAIRLELVTHACSSCSCWAVNVIHIWFLGGNRRACTSPFPSQ